MNKKYLYDVIIIRIIFLIAAVLAAGIVAGAIALVTSMITDDVKIIVTSCLVGVWIAEVLLYILRSRLTYRKRIKAIETDSREQIVEIKRKLIKLYAGYTVFFSLIIGYVFFELQQKLINDLTGVYSAKESSALDNKLILYLKISVAVLLVVFFIMKKMKKRKRNISNSFNPNN